MTQWDIDSGTGVAMAAGDTICVADAGISSYAGISGGANSSELVVLRDGGERMIPVDTRLVCALCCE